MSASASAQFFETSKTIHAIYSILRWRSRSPTRNSRLARSSTVVQRQDSNAVSAAFMAGSTWSLPAFWWMPTISDGFAGFSDLIFSAVLTRLPPMMRSYSRPNWPRTLAMAARILRALSSLRKSKNGSVTNGPECRLTRGRTGASNVAMGVILSKLRGQILGLAGIFYTSGGAGSALPGFPKRGCPTPCRAFCDRVGNPGALTMLANVLQASPLSTPALPALHHLQLLSPDEAPRRQL